MLKFPSSAKFGSNASSREKFPNKKARSYSGNRRPDLKFIKESPYTSSNRRRFHNRGTIRHSKPSSDRVMNQEQVERISKLKKRTKYELMMEAFHVANLFYYMNETSESGEMDTFYIISTSWFDKWKAYVNFDYFMENTDKFLRLKHKKGDTYTSENYMTDLDEEIKKEIEKYFDSFFLVDNSDNFPGVISNKELIYDKGMCYINLDNLKSHLNYNIVEQCQNGRDYIIISEQIWKYFKTVYSGKEIKRYKIKLPLNNNEVVIESKLKNILICIARFKKSNLTQRLSERPKLMFYPRRKSIYEFKKHLVSIFSFLDGLSTKDIRLWILDAKFNFDLLEEYLVQHLSERNFSFQEDVTFPGFNLDLIDNDVLIGEIDEIIQNKILVLEYVDNNTHNNFIFKQQYLSEFSKDIRDTIRIIQRRSKDQYAQMNLISWYDRIHYNNKEKDEEKLFRLGEYFLTRYGLIGKDYPYSKYNLNLDNKDLESLLLIEIEELRQNMHLIFEKGELLQKFSYCYTNPMNQRTPVVMSKDDLAQSKDLKLISRHDLIMRKRERSKMLDQMLYKKTADIETEEKHSHIIAESPQELKEDPLHFEDVNKTEEENLVVCNYCSKELEEEHDTCEKCQVAKYCNKSCKNKDLRFHKVKCLN